MENKNKSKTTGNVLFTSIIRRNYDVNYVPRSPYERLYEMQYYGSLLNLHIRESLKFNKLKIKTNFAALTSYKKSQVATYKTSHRAFRNNKITS